MNEWKGSVLRKYTRMLENAEIQMDQTHYSSGVTGSNVYKAFE